MVGQFAFLATALFAGASLYINVVEQPARMGLADGAALAQWQPAYRRGYAMQSTLALLAFALGAASWWRTGGSAYLVGAVLMLANWPWTLLFIRPTNSVLMAIDPGAPDERVRPLLNRWSRLHGVRTVLAATACATFIVALSGPGVAA